MKSSLIYRSSSDRIKSFPSKGKEHDQACLAIGSLREKMTGLIMKQDFQGYWELDSDHVQAMGISSGDYDKDKGYD